MSSPTRIVDRGYRSYDGPRQGTAHAVRSLVAHTLRRILGLGRPARAKLLPFLTIVLSYLPATAFIGIVALVGSPARALVPGYSDYYGFVISAIVLFVAFVAPEAVCPDRRSRVLSLYLASPLTRGTYVLAKVLAVGTVIAFVTIGPPMLLLVGMVVQDAGPAGPGEVAVLVLRIVASGAVLAAAYTAVSMAASSLTDRRAVAAAGTLGVLTGSAVVTGTLHFALQAPGWVLAANLTRAPLDLVNRIHGGPGLPPHMSTPHLVAGVAAWTGLAAGVTLWRWLRLQVTR